MSARRSVELAIVGYCPMGCGPTLVLGHGGYPRCSYVQCPRPTAVADLLEDRETEHLVVFGESGFTVRHPLRERLDDELMRCELHTFCAQLPGPPSRPGTYRAVPGAPGDWLFRALPDLPVRGDAQRGDDRSRPAVVAPAGTAAETQALSPRPSGNRPGAVPRLGAGPFT